MSTKLVEDACGETDKTLSNWIRIVDECGFEGLRPRKQPGRPQSLTKDQKENSRGGRDWPSGKIESTSEERSLRATCLRHSLMP